MWGMFRLLPALGFCLLPLTLFGQSADTVVAITGVNVIDVVNGKTAPAHTVLIGNGRITAMGPHRDS